MVKTLTLPARPSVKTVGRFAQRSASLISGSKNVILVLRVKPSDLAEPPPADARPPEPDAAAGPPAGGGGERTDGLGIMRKVRDQQRFLRTDSVPRDRRSDCWWCAGPFENEPYYIPHSVVGEEALGYGSFCIPQCAVAYLHAEKGLDASTVFERDQMLNHYYGRADGLGSRARIAPAQDPKRLLLKYFGPLTYPEYRELCASGYMLAPAERPITRVVSELHDVIDPLVLKEFDAKTLLGANGYKVKMRKGANRPT